MGKSEKRPKRPYKMGNGEIIKVKEEKDLGMIIQEKHVEKIF